jgi:hypothetical protein
MTDIRRHGFESDAQWREYLAEIEETAADSHRNAGQHEVHLRQLAKLTMDVEDLRQRVQARLRHRAAIARRRKFGVCLVLAMLAAAWRAMLLHRSRPVCSQLTKM